jgi:thioredoxin-like negative regulator of GroEL
MYKLGARIRGIRPGSIVHVDLAELGAARSEGEIVVQFTHPLCTDCRTLEEELRSAGRNVFTVDVSRRPELARKYGIALVPTAVAVAPGGSVTARLA